MRRLKRQRPKKVKEKVLEKVEGALQSNAEISLTAESGQAAGKGKDGETA